MRLNNYRIKELKICVIEEKGYLANMQPASQVYQNN